MEIERKVSTGKKNQSVFWFEIKVKDFAEFVFTSWALCCLKKKFSHMGYLKSEVKITVGDKKNNCGCRARA